MNNEEHNEEPDLSRVSTDGFFDQFNIDIDGMDNLMEGIDKIEKDEDEELDWKGELIKLVEEMEEIHRLLDYHKIPRSVEDIFGINNNYTLMERVILKIKKGGQGQQI